MNENQLGLLLSVLLDPRGKEQILKDIEYIQEVVNKTIYTFSELVGNLSIKGIRYFIYEKETESKYTELLTYFYTVKLYEYGNLLIMFNNSI